MVPEAARAGAQDRLRPILMTACAMTVGMVPMALALEHGSEMQAPLGRAVIGGLVVSTFVTLFIVPSVFALLMGRHDAALAVAVPRRPGQLALRPRGPQPEAALGDPRLSPRCLGGPPMNRIWLTLLLLPGLACGCSEPEPACRVADQPRPGGEGGPRPVPDREAHRRAAGGDRRRTSAPPCTRRFPASSRSGTWTSATG